MMAVVQILFIEAAFQGLTSEGDELVSRRHQKKLNARLTEDITRGIQINIKLMDSIHLCSGDKEWERQVQTDTG